MKRLFISSLSILILLAACSQPAEETKDVATNAVPEAQSFTVMVNGITIGKMDVITNDNNIAVEFGYKNNGRGPTYKENIVLNATGFPVDWQIKGNSTFGNAIEESFLQSGDTASWTDATGSGETKVTEPSLYINQFGSPYAGYIFANALLNAKDQKLSALPAGQLNLKTMEEITITGADGDLVLTSYALSGADINPDYFILDSNNHYFAYISSKFSIIRKGFETEDEKLRAMAEKYSAERYERIQSEVAHKYNGPVRIRNVRIFDPQTLSLTEPVSVVVTNDKISAIDKLSVATEATETEIDGSGGTLVAGLYDMHGHMGAEDALLNIAAGVTSVRDMGNSNEVLDELIKKIDSGVLAGPRITRYGFIEGKSPFSSNNGILVETEEQALEAVRTYAAKGFSAVKLYNSMNGDWAPAIVKEAHRLNMRVVGHVPAFSNANDMIKAGFDEMTHINQIMLGWVLEPGEDTRSLLRLTALNRLPTLDLTNQAVAETIKMMADRGVAMDPTMAIHEYLLLSRNGETRAGVSDYIDNMPPTVQRASKVALASIASDKEDKDYRGAFSQISKTVTMMKDAGIQLIPGTDLGGGLTLHRELEIYQEFGFSSAEVLKLGTSDMANYLGQENLGSIEVDKLADFFLIPGDPTKDFKAIKRISLVSKGGVFYFPSEIYPKFGITPFTELPQVKVSD
jgi:imidazolonepropionase-like amidohydrolase